MIEVKRHVRIHDDEAPSYFTREHIIIVETSLMNTIHRTSQSLTLDV